MRERERKRERESQWFKGGGEGDILKNKGEREIF